MCEQREVLTGGTWPKFFFGLKCAAVMVVGGGGGAPSAPSPGGAGAGGMILSPGPVAIIGCSESSTVAITIGAGGSGGACGGGCGSLGAAGNDTTVTITGGTPLVAKGGGRGQSPGDQPCTAATIGGSGGGGRGEDGTPGNSNPGSASNQVPSMPSSLQPFGFGNAGGLGYSCGQPPAPRAGAGGGGAGGAGCNADSNQGAGGDGKDVAPIFGSAPQPFYIANGPNAGPSVSGIFAGGGGGRRCAAQSNPDQNGAGGPGGGGNGGAPSGSPLVTGSGTANTGGGGGAGFGPIPNTGTSSGPGGSGGSGIVLVRVPGPKVPSGFAVAPGTNTLTTQPCGAKVAAFTVSGTLTIS
jgi:hypothetical protein